MKEVQEVIILIGKLMFFFSDLRFFLFSSLKEEDYKLLLFSAM